jgi:hypothetical protein
MMALMKVVKEISQESVLIKGLKQGGSSRIEGLKPKGVQNLIL